MFSVLHVEHNRFYHAIVRNMIVDEELQYIPVKSPEEAFKVLENTKINMIITGLIFEGETGEQFIEDLNKSKYKNLPILILSSNDEGEMRKILQKLGDIDFINKNASLDKFKSYINKYRNRESAYEKLKKVNIGVLDSNEYELKIIQNMFALNNVTNVDYYSDPELFLESKEDYSLNLIDYTLPKLSGGRVIKSIRSRNVTSLILAFSGSEDENAISNIIDAGANDYIVKPIKEDVFLTRLRVNLTSYLLTHEVNVNNMALQEKDINLDGLTKLYNKKFTFKRLEEEVKRHKRFKDRLSIAIINVDKFERINTIYGKAFGDEVIVKISNILKNQIRLTDILGRYNGDEFILIMTGTDLEGAGILCDKLRRKIEDTDFGSDELMVTVSGGLIEANYEEPLELIDKAKELVNCAKNKGRNRIEYEYV